MIDLEDKIFDKFRLNGNPVVGYKPEDYNKTTRIITIKMPKLLDNILRLYRLEYGHNCLYLDVVSPTTGKIVTFMQPARTANAICYVNNELNLTIKLKTS